MPKKPYNRKDRFYKKAKEAGFRSRAAYKLLELNDRFRLFRPGMQVVELGSAPGGWSQVIAKEVGPTGNVVAVDLDAPPVPPSKNICFVKGDIREEQTKQRVFAELGEKVDLVLSDLAPNFSGVKFQDQYHSYELAQHAYSLCQAVLKKKGDFVVKIFPGQDLEDFKRALQESFPQVRTYIPEATRKSSSEIYLVAKGFSPSTNGDS